MAFKHLLVDDTTGKYKRGSAPGSGTDQDFDIGAGGVVEVTVSADLTVTTSIDVFINGKLTREGATKDWTRDIVNDKILFNYTVPENAWVRVRTS